MQVSRQSMRLYVVTDRKWLGGARLADRVEQSILGGATFIQLCEKELPFAAFLEQAKQVKAVTDRYQIPFVINDSLEVMLACGADGIHIGSRDMPAAEARRILGPDRILGVSANSVESALAAQRAGADYLGVGAVYATSTKPDASALPHQTLRAICSAVDIPVVAIGDIGRDNLLGLKGTGLDGVAVVSAVFAQPDVQAASRELRALSEEMTS